MEERGNNNNLLIMMRKKKIDGGERINKLENGVYVVGQYEFLR